MIGYHAVAVIADAYLKGIRGYDAEAALAAMVSTASYGPYGGLAQYRQLGYVPIDEEGEAASKTLEYAFDDWSIAQMAQAMGRTQIAAQFMRRAASWKNAYDPHSGFMRARRRDGSWRTPFDPAASGYGSDYTEGNAWQYSWYVPQDVAGLARARGGAQKLWRSWMRCSSEDRCAGVRPHGGHHRPHRLVRARQRGPRTTSPTCTPPPGGVALRTQARLARSWRASTRRAPGSGRQRRPRPDVGVVPVPRSGSTRSRRPATVHPRPKPVRVTRDAAPDAGQDLHGDRQRARGGASLRGRGDAERQTADARVPAPRGDPRRGRAGLHDAGAAETRRGRGARAQPLLDVARARR